MDITVVTLIGIGALLSPWILPIVWRRVSNSIVPNDELQAELAALIIEFTSSRMDDSALDIFTVSTFRAFTMSMILDPQVQRIRLMAALRRVQPNITPVQFRFLKQVFNYR